MRYWLLASMVTLSSFAIGLVLMSAVDAALVSSFRQRLARWPSSVRATALLCLRVLPVVSALAFGAALVFPTFLYYEPRNTDEPLTGTVAAIAVLGFLTLLWSAFRTTQSWISTRRLGRHWKRAARVVVLPSNVRAFVVDDPFPIVAVVGWRKPALFISERVLSECTTGEIEAMIRHERAHIASRDNLKRLALRGCPRLPFSSELDAAWNMAAEEAADARAAGNDAARRLDLAHALIRLARLAPIPNLPAGISAFYPGGSVEHRVRLLLEPATQPGSSRVYLLAGLAATLLAGGFIVSAPAIHAAMEALVRLVP
ncbi:MAG TPA: M48 family metalloprotease [Vicinamibacterales bacterium]|jgi:hypothetical protein|nr:M48 family metalloprotease [Vicinamibacterales bacterium]